MQLLVSRQKAGLSRTDYIYHKFDPDKLPTPRVLLTALCSGKRLEREHIRRPETIVPAQLCTRCFTPAEINQIAEVREEFMESERIYPPSTPPPGGAQMTVTWMDGHSEVFDLQECQGWKINRQRNMLVLGGPPPRLEIPLCNVRHFFIEPKG